MEKVWPRNLFYLEQCKVLYYFGGNCQLKITNRSFVFLSESMLMPYRNFFCTMAEIIEFCLMYLINSFGLVIITQSIVILTACPQLSLKR